MFISDVGFTDKSKGDELNNRVEDKTVVVDVFIVVSAASSLPHVTLKFPFGPPVNR